MSRNLLLVKIALLVAAAAAAPVACDKGGDDGGESAAHETHVCTATGTFLPYAGRGRSGPGFQTREAAQAAAMSQACTNIANSVLTASEVGEHLAGFVVVCLESTVFEMDCEVEN